MPLCTIMPLFQENILPSSYGISSDTQSLRDALKLIRLDLGLNSTRGMPKMSSQLAATAHCCSIDWPQNKLMSHDNQKPLRSTDKISRLVSCIIDFFTPPNGYVLDPYAGTMPLALAALRTERRCVSFEQDEGCFKTALE